MIGQCFDVQYTLPAPVTISACHVDCGPCGFILNHRNCQDYLFQSLYRNLLNFDIAPNFQFYNLCYVQILRRVSQSIETLKGGFGLSVCSELDVLI